MVVFAFFLSYRFYADDGLFRGYVCQCLTRSTIAYGVDAFDVRLVVLICNDLSFVGLDAEAFESDVLYVGYDTYGA